MIFASKKLVPPTVVANPAHSRPPRRPRRSKQPPIDVSPFVAPARLTASDLDKRSPQYRIAHVQHFRALKADFPVLDKKMYQESNKASLGVSLRRFQEWFQQYEKDLEKRNRINRSLPLFLLEVNSRRTSCMLLWPCYPCDQLNTMEVPRIQIFLVVF